MNISSTQQTIHALEAVRRQKRFWQLGLSLGLFCVVVGCLLTLRNAVYGLAREGATQEAFVKDLSGRLQETTLPSIEQMGSQALHEINWQEEVQKLNRRTPEVAQASMQQMKLLGSDLESRGKKVFSSAFDAALKQRESKVKALFPEATPEQVSTLMTALTQETQDQVADISSTLFYSHKKALDGMVTDLNKIQIAEAAHIKNEPPTWEMGLLIFDIARADFKDLEPSGETNAKTKQSATQEAKK